MSIESAKLTIKVGKEEIAEKMGIDVEELTELCNYPRFKPSSTDGIQASLKAIVDSVQETLAGAEFGNDDAQAIAIESVAVWAKMCVDLFMGRKVMNDAARIVHQIPVLETEKAVKEEAEETVNLGL